MVCVCVYVSLCLQKGIPCLFSLSNYNTHTHTHTHTHTGPKEGSRHSLFTRPDHPKSHQQPYGETKDSGGFFTCGCACVSVRGERSRGLVKVCVCVCVCMCVFLSTSVSRTIFCLPPTLPHAYTPSHTHTHTHTHRHITLPELKRLRRQFLKQATEWGMAALSLEDTHTHTHTHTNTDTHAKKRTGDWQCLC